MHFRFAFFSPPVAIAQSGNRKYLRVVTICKRFNKHKINVIISTTVLLFSLAVQRRW